MKAACLLVSSFALCLLLAPEGAGRAAPPFGALTTVQLPPEQVLDDAALADFDGDGALDLILASHARKQPFERYLRIHHRVSASVCYPPSPDRDLRLHPDVVAFCPGDVTAAPGAEIVLFTATGAFAWSSAAGEKDLPEKLATADFLWQLPHSREVFLWRDGVRDVDGDGLADLFLPEAGGYRIFFQARDGTGATDFTRTAYLGVPEYVPAMGRASVAAARDRLKKLRTSLALGEGRGGEPDDLIRVDDSVPYPVLADFDGDGRSDVLAVTDTELLVWRQGQGGVFREAPDLRLPLPLSIDAGRRLDVSFSAHVRDLDGDGRADFVLVAGDRSAQSARTQVLVYTQAGEAVEGPGAPIFGARPRDAMFLGGFAGLLDLTDVNGDGLPDLVMGSVRVDALDAIRAATKGDLDVDLTVYLNQRGRFSKRPDLNLGFPIPARDVRGAGKTVTARFLGDLTGSGVADLLLRDDPERIRVLAVRRTPRGLDANPRAIFDARIEKRAEVRIEPAGSGRPEILVLERSQVQHVRFPR